MDKEEKKERRQGYFARLKKKRPSKQNSELTSSNSHVTSVSTPKDDSMKVILGQISEKATDEEKKKKRIQGKQLRRSENKRCSAGENHNKNEKKEKKMVMKRPPGTIQYTATAADTLNCIALKFNITPNKLVELNRLFTHTIVPGQVLYVPDGSIKTESSTSSNVGVLASPMSSDAEYDKLLDANMARKAPKPIERILSSTSEEEEPIVVKFLKMNCRYITDGKGVVGGVMIITPNNVMFDPHKSDPLVIENGCEEYGLICPMEEVVSIALYSDVSHMKIKDALPSDIPKDLCPLYRPGEWEDLSSEKDTNPFSKFKSLGKEKKHGLVEAEITDNRTNSQIITDHKEEIESEFQKNKIPVDLPPVALKTNDQIALSEQPPEQSVMIGCSETKHCPEDNLQDLVESTDEQKTKILDDAESNRIDSKVNEVEELIADSSRAKSEDKAIIESNACLEAQLASTENRNIELCLHSTKENPPMSQTLMSSVETKAAEVSVSCIDSELEQIKELIGVNGTEDNINLSKTDCVVTDKSPDSLSPCSPEDSSQKDTQMDSESELKLWFLKRMQVPIEDMLPSKEEKSKIPPMFLCIRVGKPMRKSFATQSTAVVQQYAQKRKQPEYWFAVPQERVDHLYTFFVQWSPEVYGKDAKEQGFVVVEKEELHMIDNFFSEPSTKSWEVFRKRGTEYVYKGMHITIATLLRSGPIMRSREKPLEVKILYRTGVDQEPYVQIITVEEAKRRKSTCSYEDEEETEDFLPDLKHKSLLLNDMHVEKLAHRLPARVQGYSWNLVYSTHKHGTSLKTLYRNLSSLDSPVLLVIKDMDNQVFGSYATHPFRLSDHYYGTGETFLFTFNPDFKLFKWSGENSYFINGDICSLEIGGGGGRFGLWVDADLYHGRSNTCSTFNNETLSKKEDFIVQDVEVWAFA